MIAFSWNGFDFAQGDHVTCSGETKDLYPHCANCKMNAILKVAMSRPELVRYAYYKLSTGSGRNYDLINDTLNGLYDAFGHVTKIHYKLRYVERPTTYKDDSGKRRSTKKWFLELEPSPDDLRLLYAQQRARLFSIAQIQPPAQDGEPLDVDAEFVTDDPAPPSHAGSDAPAESAPQPDTEAVQAVDAADEQSSDEPGRPDAPPLTPEQQAAYYFTLPSGEMLGQCDLNKLADLKAWCEERPNQAPAQVTLLHAKVMLDYAMGNSDDETP